MSTKLQNGETVYAPASRIGLSDTAPTAMVKAKVTATVGRSILLSVPHVTTQPKIASSQVTIHHPSHRERALAIGEALGVYRDCPVSKGCTSPFAPIWIKAMVDRQG